MNLRFAARIRFFFYAFASQSLTVDKIRNVNYISRSNSAPLSSSILPSHLATLISSSSNQLHIYPRFPVKFAILLLSSTRNYYISLVANRQALSYAAEDLDYTISSLHYPLRQTKVLLSPLNF
ncbi:uncharacterized protein BDCG_16239 [Blastomyces dermatitidis ER-3]|uniref:Uncharacterized protein n=1 Tax=Ajellomyces dermatitidis (strain ER-3 / ATCC MYA-2586) TaxID=559297 RepID=A0ABX2VRR6_AJEDR|nr:uncharacterized protein BDCG_16239 [Blastomyces dermatitidis ER-3]OAS99639.1 hypothetical protein BDCG_16239 [Blastomyces dermatitidis ER-3]